MEEIKLIVLKETGIEYELKSLFVEILQISATLDSNTV